VIPTVAEIKKKHFTAEQHPYRLLERKVGILHRDMTLLDIGCGRTAPVLRMYANSVRECIGVDLIEFTENVDGVKLYNDDVAKLVNIGTNSVDVCYSRSVMEHVKDADAAFAQINRVLKLDGRYVFLTPSLFDYGSLISMLVPNRFHPYLVRITEGRDEHDTFPAFYQCNTKARVRSLAEKHGFEIDNFQYVGQYPAYLSFNRLLFLIGTYYEKLISKFESLHFLKGWIMVEVVKRRDSIRYP